MLNGGPCRGQDTGRALQATGAPGCEGAEGSGLPCPAWPLVSLGQDPPGRPGTSPGPIAVCVP